MIGDVPAGAAFGPLPPLPARGVVGLEARERRRFIFLMPAPATVLLLGLTLIPFLVGLGFSLTSYHLGSPGDLRFVGLDNYTRLVTSEDFLTALRVTTLFTLLAVAIQLVLGVGIAALLHHETRAVPLLRLIYLLPLAITPVAAVFTFRMMLNPSLGVLNQLLRAVGLPPQDWLGTPVMALVSLLLVDT